jgi:hypothetical protein
MKSRRLTILCVAAIALAGTPRAWHEFRKALAFVQHKVQVKLWSMVLEPKDHRTDVQLVEAIQQSGAKPVEVASNCPSEREESQRNHVSNRSETERRTDFPRFRPGKAREEIAAAPATLIAKALKTPRGVGSLESLGHGSVTIGDPLGFAESGELSLISGTAAALPQPPAGKAEAFKFALIPMANPIVSTLLEKETVVQLKLMKKVLEENRLIRPKSCPKSRISEFGLRI